MITKVQQHFNITLESIEDLSVSQEGFLGRLFTRRAESLMAPISSTYKHAIANMRREYLSLANPHWVRIREVTGKELHDQYACKSLSRFGQIPEDMVKAIDEHVEAANQFLDGYLPLLEKVGIESEGPLVKAVMNYHPNLDGLMNDRMVIGLVHNRAKRKEEERKRKVPAPAVLPALTEEAFVALAKRNLKLIDDYIALRERIKSHPYTIDHSEYEDDFEPITILNRLLHTVDALQSSIHKWLSKSTK